MDEIERGETGLRIVYSLLYFLIIEVLEAILLLVVVFELLYTLVTREAPGPGIRQFANRVISYFYRIGRYLTYNDSEPPFPFSDFPVELEPTGSPSR